MPQRTIVSLDQVLCQESLLYSPCLGLFSSIMNASALSIQGAIQGMAHHSLFTYCFIRRVPVPMHCLIQPENSDDEELYPSWVAVDLD